MIKRELKNIHLFMRTNECLEETGNADSGESSKTYALGDLFVQFHFEEDSYDSGKQLVGLSFVKPVTKEVTSYV